MAAATRRHETFQQLRPVCSILLQHRSSSSHLHDGLTALLGLLRSSDPRGLSGCMDYVLFPLMLVIDSVAPLRRHKPPAGAPDPEHIAAPPPSADAEEGDEAAVPAARTDKVAEAALGEGT